MNQFKRLHKIMILGIVVALLAVACSSVPGDELSTPSPTEVIEPPQSEDEPSVDEQPTEESPDSSESESETNDSEENAAPSEAGVEEKNSDRRNGRKRAGNRDDWKTRPILAANIDWRRDQACV